MKYSWQIAFLLLGLIWMIGIPVTCFLFSSDTDIAPLAMIYFTSLFPVIGFWVILVIEKIPLTRRIVGILFGSLLIQLVMVIQVMNLPVY